MPNKRGQFYLITAVIIIALIMGFVSVSNSSKKHSIGELSPQKEVLEIEARAVLDHIAYQKLDGATDPTSKEMWINFTTEYAKYSSVENIYFIFGDSTEITVAGWRKLTPGGILVNFTSSDGVELIIPKNVYTPRSYAPSSNTITLTIDRVPHEFELKTGENFYFVISQQNDGESHIITGGIISEN